jgi:hypothetical protein
MAVPATEDDHGGNTRTSGDHDKRWGVRCRPSKTQQSNYYDGVQRMTNDGRRDDINNGRQMTRGSAVGRGGRCKAQGGQLSSSSIEYRLK